ncbi:hypothetical protein PIB30_100687 [Stylosanthes scabra]|uniref:Uncharacterized protein n=1 Tax=Stylosanthes scabra TaxID=79078 RepID=A0ABU6VX09_9FABA|nr:hypothetical protein [Stylosanthes scabra]
MALVTFGRSYQVASRRRALEWRALRNCAVPWRVRTLPLVALGTHSGTIVPPRAPDIAPARCPYTLNPRRPFLSSFTLFLPQVSSIPSQTKIQYSHTHSSNLQSCVYSRLLRIADFDLSHFPELHIDKKGKKALRHLVSKVYASQAATMNLAAAKPPAMSAPNKPKNTKKEPVVIDLTADSESEGTAKRRSCERKLKKAFWHRLELGNPLVLNHSPHSHNIREFNR